LGLSLTAPRGDSSGERYRVEVTVTSTKRPEKESTLTSSGNLAPPPPEQVPGTLFPSWDTTFDAFVNQTGNPSFFFGGDGDIPSVGEVYANLSFDIQGVKNASLRVMKKNWGFTLDSASISGSYLGVNGSPLFMGDWDNSSARLIFSEQAKGFSLEREGEYWDLRAVLATDEEEGFSLAELQGVYEFSTGQVLDGLITTAESNGETGTIIEAGLELGGEDFVLYPAFVNVFPGYPNQLPSRTYDVDVNWEGRELTTNFNWYLSQTRLGTDPNTYWTTENNLNASTSIELGENMDSQFSLSWTRRASNDTPKSTDVITQECSGSISGGEVLTWSLGGSFRKTVDHISDTTINVQNINSGVEFELGESEHFVSSSFRKTLAPNYEDYSSSLSLTSRFPDAPLSPTFTLTRGDTDTTARVNLSETGGDGLSLNLSFSASLVQQDSVSLSITASYPGIFPFIGKTKGQVEGYLFIDENRNGVRDEEEQGVQNALLSLSNLEAITGERGNFVLPPVQPGRYKLKIQEVKSGLKPTIQMPYSIEVKAGEVRQVDIPLQPRSWIRGLVFDDDNQNETRDQGEPGMGGIRFSIVGEDIEKTIRSGSNGRFTIDLTPGTYRVKLQEDSLPERYELTTPESFEVKAEKYGRTEVIFGVHQKPRPIEVTFGPPTAEFSYQPEEPTVGREILLDGSRSSAIQTEIESYEWKLTHADREITRKGEKVRVTLPETGKWEVSLTVTDQNDLKGKAVKTITVSE
ncbi:hypothetical protein KGY71_05490, partial [Candidatus Bipolaricaulota bacterium]|nr:hypothetical protein [Candidatus Bipolaricaulota bacterium]